MASGYGLSGGTSRCFPFWQELLACYVVNTAADDVSGGKKCIPAYENYFECLSHKKEEARAVAMQTALRKKMAQQEYEQPKPESIRSLGLLDKQSDWNKVSGVPKK